MKTIKKSFRIIIGIALFMAASDNRAQAESAVVGRISHIEGQLLRYVPEDKDWVATVTDAPFGFNDALYSTKQSRAEIIMPNNTWIRIGSDTQLQLLSVANNLTEVDVGFGMARLYNRSSAATLRATTPFGYVTASPTACFDVYVGDESAEVIALNGTVDFVHVNGGTYEVKTGLSSVIADKQQVSSGSGRANSDWNAWNVSQNHVWDNRAQLRGQSVKYLPEPLHTESYVLEENGRWESVYYENEYRYFWRPRVSVGWVPFTVGRWTTWYGDHCWIPAEPFGYVTHHYGNWVYANNFWYWAPPIIGVALGPIGIGFGWYPGRVSWIHSGVHVGWVPLAPREVYYSNRYWGPHSVVVSPKVHMNMGRYRYIDRAVIIHRDNLYHVADYSSVKIAHINHKTLIKNYRPAPVMNHTVIRNYDSIPQRHHYTNTVVTEKPRHSTVDRIQQNQHYRSPDRTPIQPSRHGESGQSDSMRIHRPVTPTTPFGESRQPTQPTQPNRHGESGQSGQPDSMRIHRPVTPTTPFGKTRQPTQPTQPNRHGESGQSGQTDNMRIHRPVTPTTPSAPLTPSVPSDSNRRTQPVQPMQPTQPSRHGESGQSGQSDSMRIHRPVSPTPSATSDQNRIKIPVQPMQPTQPTQPSRHGESGQSGQSDSMRIHRPVSPPAPSQPTQPLQPERSSQRETMRTYTPPSAPVAPSMPSDSNRHTQPIQPRQPVTPAAPSMPSDRNRHTQPVQPRQPEQPAKQTTPATPKKSRQPDELQKPSGRMGIERYRERQTASSGQAQPQLRRTQLPQRQQHSEIARSNVRPASPSVQSARTTPRVQDSPKPKQREEFYKNQRSR